MKITHSKNKAKTLYKGLPSRVLGVGFSLLFASLPSSQMLASQVSFTGTVPRETINTTDRDEAFAVEQRTHFKVVGTIIGDDGMPMSGVIILVKDTKIGSISDLNGQYIIDVPSENDILEFSCLGYQTVNMLVGNQRMIDVIMKEEVLKINDIVVTALGIKKEEKSLTYATQLIDGDELTRVKDINFMNSLSGKVAGMNINHSASGLGGSVKVRIRGTRSVNGSNQPLYVIDGIPINSTSKELTLTTLGGYNDAQNRDSGDGISNLNPDDIESINILKGPAAAALYGSSAANGVIVITTKQGKVGRTNLTFNSSTTWEKAAYGIPEFQNNYGGVTSSWGNEIAGSEDYAKKFFRTGVSTINSVALSAGTETLQSYFSYANTYNKGLIDRSDLNKHNLSFRETAYFLDDRFRVDSHINLIYQKVNNRPTPGGFYMNPLVGLYKFPRGGVQGGESLDYYKEQYKVLDPSRNIYTQNWYTTPTSFEQNPFWLTNCTMNEDKRYRVIGNLNLSYQLNSHFSVQTRGHIDFISDAYEAKYKAGTDPSLVGKNGRFISDSSNQLSAYADAILAYAQEFRNITLHATLGASFKDVTGKSLGFDSKTYMFNPNIFTVNNIDNNNSAPFLNKFQTQEQAVFLAGQIGFKDYIYLDMTARNDWTSTLAFTKYKSKGFFYPSAGATWIISNCFHMPDWISMGKVRAAWSLVGNGLPKYLSYPLNTIGNGGSINFNTKAPFSELKPEKTESIEVGTEWRLFNNMIDVDVTYYQTRTRNQIFTLKAPAGSKYTFYYVNAGDIKNEGVEVMLATTPINVDDLKWKSSVNFALNRNTVVDLVDGLGHFDVTNGITSNSYVMRLEKGGSFGDIYGRKFMRDENGKYLYDTEGMPIPDKSDLKKVGNANPDFQIGWQNQFRIKDFTVSFLIDGSFGGDVMSLTEAELDKYGVSKNTGNVRQQGGVSFGGNLIDDPERFYTIVGGRDGISENYVYDATNIRLRELAISYSLPVRWLARQSVLKGLEVSLIGRNLFFFMNKAPYDPDAALSVGNSLQGVDVFGMPTTRSVGFNLKVKF